MTEYEIIQILSGKNDFGAPKSGFGLYHEILGSNETCRSVDQIYIEKPEIRIFRDFNNIVRIDFVYKFPDDMDLIGHYDFLEQFFQPENSANFTDDDVNLYVRQLSELEDGEHISDEERVVLYHHVLTLNIISLSPRGKFSLTTKDNPLFYSLVSEKANGPAKILRMVYQKDDVLFEELSDDDTLHMEKDLINEIEIDMQNMQNSY